MSNSESQDEVDHTDNNTAPVSSGSVCQDQSCNVICNAEPRKPPKQQLKVLCRAWKFRYVVPCTTNSPAAFEKNITTMLEINRPKNIIYLVVRYNALQLPQDLNPTKVTIQGFLQGKLYASTLRKWHNFEWSPVQGGLCGDLEFENFSEDKFPYVTVPVFGTLRLNNWGRSELFRKRKVRIFHVLAIDSIRSPTRLNKNLAAV